MTAEIAGAAADTARADEARDLVSPVGNPEAGDWVGGEPRPDPAAWRDTADRRTGSCREAWASWVTGPSGAEVEATSTRGSGPHSPLRPAPGAFLLDHAP